MVARIKEGYPHLQVIAGNIATAEAARAGRGRRRRGQGRHRPRLDLHHAHRAGVGVPQITAVANVAAALEGQGVPLIADGGIRYSGDIAKAIAAGAHCGDDRQPVRRHRGGAGRGRALPGPLSYKSYRGMGSLGAMASATAPATAISRTRPPSSRSWCPKASRARALQGAAARPIVHQLAGGLRAAMGYTGCGTSTRCARGRSSCASPGAGVRESHVHDVTITKEAPNYRVSRSSAVAAALPCPGHRSPRGRAPARRR
jgi:IMP dehydrogenase